MILTCSHATETCGRHESEKQNAGRQGISNDGCTPYHIKLRINAKDKNVSIAQDAAIANAYGDKFIIPLSFEMLDSLIPYYQSRLGNRLCYKITFNNYGRVIVSTAASQDASYKISDISLKYEMVIQPDLARRDIKTWLCCTTEFSDTDKLE